MGESGYVRVAGAADGSASGMCNLYAIGATWLASCKSALQGCLALNGSEFDRSTARYAASAMPYKLFMWYPPSTLTRVSSLSGHRGEFG